MENNTRYQKLQESLHSHIELLEKTAQAILDQDISNYPIFIVNDSSLAVGIGILEFDLEGKPFVVSVSTLEELATKQVVQMDKVNDFKAVYKKNKHTLCLLIPEENGGAFIFLPKK